MGLLVAYLVILTLIALFHFAIKLETRVADQALHIRLFPFANKTITLADIETVERITYSPLRDYGGWGVRYGRGGKMYNMRGNEAVRFVKKSGDIFNVGTQSPDKLIAAVKRK